MKEDAAIKFTSEVESIFKAWLDAPETKAFIEETQKAADGETGTFEVAITSEDVDRYQEVIKLDGWDLVHYRNNPVVLWGHDHHQLPIGIATELTINDGKMIAKGKFAPHAFAQTIRQLYDMGMMRATSVGFIEKEREGNFITKAELLEFSFVSVPANPFALSTLVKAERSINEMITKGILRPADEKEAPAEPELAVDPEPAPEDPIVEEKQVTIRAIEPIVASLKGAIVALEALSVKDAEPEGDGAPAAATEEEKQLAEFSAKRKTLQEAATILGDVLAEARQVVEARS